MKTGRHLCPWLVLVVLGCCLTGCLSERVGGEQPIGQSPEQIAEMAADEGYLTIYASASESQIQKIADAFMAAHPEISVEYFRAAGTALLNRYASEAEAHSVAADVFMPTIQPSFIDEHADWFAELNPTEIPTIARWPAQFRTDRAVETAVEEIVLTYNRDTIASVPTSWADVVDDATYRGRIVLVDPLASPSYMSWYAIMREELGDDFLRRLGALQPMWVDTGAVGAQQVATGQYDLLVPGYPSHNTSLVAQGAPLEAIRDLDPTAGITTSAAISADAPNPNAARVFTDWLLSQQAYDVVCDSPVYSAVVEGTGCQPLASHYVPPRWDIPEVEQNEIVSLLGR